MRGGAKRAPGVAPPRFDPAEEGYRPEGVRVTSIEEAFRGEGREKSVARERFRGDPRGRRRRRRRRPPSPPSSRGDDATSKERRRPRSRKMRRHTSSHTWHTHTHEIGNVASIRIPRAAPGVFFGGGLKAPPNQPHATRPRSNARSAASDASAASVASRRRSSLFSAARMNVSRDASISGPCSGRRRRRRTVVVGGPKARSHSSRTRRVSSSRRQSRSPHRTDGAHKNMSSFAHVCASMTASAAA